ncbi:hypothetical protein JX265_006760 [Neoarthrinium moseri]|uniref:Uncharacterized protein n=1 Tax=Neoarthrinium moseri TaxID=1658444 RepID=A0A9P9WLB1_9PEZI|nr:hypothetical protein JX266_006922 [Neoarthrinium moseri]KAI1868781.1 hypothetical protein JX265_006760 [Neoarthrinium moseri]
MTEKLAGERFAHGAIDWAQPRLTSRELHMLRAMNLFTDRPGWHLPGSIERWREQALRLPMMSEKTWDWCSLELQDMAERFEQTRYILAFDTSSRICKSDILVDPRVIDALRSKIFKKNPDASRERDRILWYPIDPSLFPFIHGRTKVLLDGTQIPRRRAVEFTAHGTVSPIPQVKRPVRFPDLDLRDTRLREMSGRIDNPAIAHFYRWSERFQWMPCEVRFSKRNKQGVEVISYINNLHPVHEQELYGLIEQVISLSVQPWNDVLSYLGRPRSPLRIRTYGVQWEPEKPSWAKDEYLFELDTLQEDEKVRRAEEYNRILALVEEYEKIPNFYGSNTPVPEDWSQGLLARVSRKHDKLYHWLQPEPGVSFTYQEWKQGKTGRPIVGGRDLRPQSEIPSGKDWEEPRFDYPPHEFYDVRIQDTFHEAGLQVVVRVADIQLDSKQPSYQGTDWTVNGFLNEHIVATTVVFFDVSNVTNASISFRAEADVESREYEYEDYDYEELAAILDSDYDELHGGKCFQYLGQVVVAEGRMVTYPNTLQHKFEPFELREPSRPGCLRYLELHLVDPNYRIISTANVPPQQHEWWFEAGAGKINWASRNMPPEVVHHIFKDIGQWPMGIDEARKWRVEMEKEREVFMEAVMAGVEVYDFRGNE